MAISSPESLLAEAERLAAQGETLNAIEMLTAVNREHSEPRVERELVRLRHSGWSEVDRSGPATEWDVEIPDEFPDVEGIPDVPAAGLTAGMIRSAIEHHGGLVVRGLFPPIWCDRLKESIDRSWEAIARFQETQQTDPAWFDPMDTREYGLNMMARGFIMASGTAYVPDSPRLMFELLEAFDDCGVKQLVTDYFGEPPLLSLVKLAQRMLAPDASGGWHQDAAVYGMNARTVNFWVPVTRCGDTAPGLTMFPRRLDHLVATVGTKGVDEYSALKDVVAQMTEEIPPTSPVFEAGDAAIFDQFLLHETNANPEKFTDQRYGFESWFFAPSTYPDPMRWIPLAY